MAHPLLFHTFIFLAGAALIVPLASRFKLGSVIGYLLVGILIGPFGFKLIGNAQQIMSFAEFGIIMMLFLIGLELEPKMLWQLRKQIIGLGSLQVVLTTLALTGIGLLLGFNWRESLGVSMALSLSSTALVLQMLQEKNLLRTAEGETSFSVLLFQDIAVILILIILPLLAVNNGTLPARHEMGPFASYPEWLHALIVTGTIALIVIAGHFFSRHIFFMIAKTNLREVFTAAALALIVGTTLLMESIGASPALGAFVAGVVLANSEYKRTLETDIEPFKGLLLGLFFISVGMSINFSLFAITPMKVLMAVTLIVFVKALLLLILGRLFGLTYLQRFGFAFALSQVGEFAFVILQVAQNTRVISTDTKNFFTLLVALSMATTPFLMFAYFRFLVPRYLSHLPVRKFDQIKEKKDIILAGYGRFGQVIGRFLTAQKEQITVLEKDPDQINLLRKFGFQGYFGDATRLDILKGAGAEHAKLLIVSIDNIDTSIDIVEMAKQHFPHLTIYARARNRRHAYELHKAGVNYFKRDTFDSALAMACHIMTFLGHEPENIRYKAELFAKMDEHSLIKSFAFFDQESELISYSREFYAELENVLQADLYEEEMNEKEPEVERS